MMFSQFLANSGSLGEKFPRIRSLRKNWSLNDNFFEVFGWRAKKSIGCFSESAPKTKVGGQKVGTRHVPLYVSATPHSWPPPHFSSYDFTKRLIYLTCGMLENVQSDFLILVCVWWLYCPCSCSHKWCRSIKAKCKILIETGQLVRV